jgi:hypothetical protein
MHLVGNSLKDTYRGYQKLFKVGPIVENITRKFQSCYLPEESISTDESLTLWKSRLSFKQYIPKAGMKTCELCEFRTEYLWNFIVCMGAGSDVKTTISVDDNFKSSNIFLKLVQSLLNMATLYTLCATKIKCLTFSMSEKGSDISVQLVS